MVSREERYVRLCATELIERLPEDVQRALRVLELVREMVEKGTSEAIRFVGAVEAGAGARVTDHPNSS